MAKTSVKQDEQNPIDTEVLAQSIVDLSDGVKSLLSGPLKRDAIIVLLRDYTGLPKRDISTVLYGLEGLRKEYTKL